MLVVQVWSDCLVVHVCGIIPVTICRNIFKFLSVSCCCQSVDCIVAHHQRRLCNCTKECSILNCCFDDRTSIETNTDNVAVSCIRTKNVQVSVSCKNTFCCCLVGTEDSDAVFFRKDSLSFIGAKLYSCLCRNSYLDNNICVSFCCISTFSCVYIEFVTCSRSPATSELAWMQTYAHHTLPPTDPGPR